MSQPDYNLLVANKLAASGLSPEDGADLGIVALRADSLDPKFQAVGAAQLVYRDLDGENTGFFRVRYLETLPGFAGAVAKPQRYAQSAETTNWVYLPHLNGINWLAIAQDATIPVLITEGELKAACATKHGWPTLGLGGVSVWQSSKKGLALLPPLDRFNWKGRQVKIVFDSDASTNPQVASAQVRLAKHLLGLGAAAEIVSLPSALNGGKQGLDDFLVAGGDLSAVLQNARSLDLGEQLAKFNELYAFVVHQDVVLNLHSGIRYKRDSFVNGTVSHIKIYEFRTLSNGGIKREEIKVAREWLDWPARREVIDLTYAPGGDLITAEGYYNTWKGWGCAPKAGSVAPWTELLDYAFSLATEDDRKWFEMWLAYPLQKPGTKLYSGCMFWSPAQGVGKSLIGMTMKRIYGTNFNVIDNTDLKNVNFNEWSQNKQFIVGDEISGSDKRSEADHLKNLLTRVECPMKLKYLPTYYVPDCLNYFLTSNHGDSLHVLIEDRRWFIHRLPDVPLPREAYVNFLKWLDHEGGKEALFHHLLSLDTTSFDPQGRAPVTSSKLEMIDHSKSDLSAFVYDIKINQDLHLKKLQQLWHLKSEPELALNKHIKALYDPEDKTRVTAIGLGRVLASASFKSVTVDSKKFGRQRFYILANPEKWLSMKPQSVKEYVDALWA